MISSNLMIEYIGMFNMNFKMVSNCYYLWKWNKWWR